MVLKGLRTDCIGCYCSLWLLDNLIYQLAHISLTIQFYWLLSNYQQSLSHFLCFFFSRFSFKLLCSVLYIFCISNNIIFTFDLHNKTQIILKKSYERKTTLWNVSKINIKNKHKNKDNFSYNWIIKMWIIIIFMKKNNY